MSWSTKEVVITVIAAVGAILGIVNTAFAMWKKRVRLRVRVMMTCERHSRIGVDVTNLSEFPVTIQSVGFVIDSWSVRMLKRVPLLKLMAGERTGRYLMIKNPETSSQGSIARQLPAKLPSRETLIALANPDEHLKPDFSRVKRAFVLTACGVLRTGRFPKGFRAG